MLEIMEPRSEDRFRLPWDEASRRVRVVFHIAGVIGSLLPFGLIALAAQYASPMEGGSIPNETWADKIMAFGTVTSYVPCIGCPVLILFMAFGYLLVGYVAAGIIALTRWG